MKTNTKDIFIDTASSLFANQGYHATGISEILKKRLMLLKAHFIIIFPKEKNNLLKKLCKKLLKKSLQKF